MALSPSVTTEVPQELSLVEPTLANDLGGFLSPSQTRTFLACSAKWWFKFGLGLPDPPGGA